MIGLGTIISIAAPYVLPIVIGYLAYDAYKKRAERKSALSIMPRK
jgi:hypothetical protein